jgi:hypothetical protein
MYSHDFEIKKSIKDKNLYSWLHPSKFESVKNK